MLTCRVSENPRRIRRVDNGEVWYYYHDFMTHMMHIIDIPSVRSSRQSSFIMSKK